MPDPNKFDNKNDWMDACMHQLRKVENKEQDESVAQCINMWEGKKKKKKAARRVLSSYLEAVDKESGIIGVPMGAPEKGVRRKQLMEQRRITDRKPTDKGTPFAKPGEMVTWLNPHTRKEEKKRWDPKKMKPEEVVKVNG